MEYFLGSSKNRCQEKLETRDFGLYLLILILMTIFSLPHSSQFFCNYLATWRGYDHFSKRKNIQTVQPFRTHILILSMLIEIFCPQFGFSVDILSQLQQLCTNNGFYYAFQQKCVYNGHNSYRIKDNFWSVWSFLFVETLVQIFCVNQRIMTWHHIGLDG